MAVFNSLFNGKRFIELSLLLQVLGVQTPGFTAAVRLGAELLKHWHDVSATWCGPVYLSTPCDGIKKNKKSHLLLTAFKDATASVWVRNGNRHH